MLATTFEVDLGDIMVSMGELNIFIIEIHVLIGLQRMMSPVEIKLPGVGVMGYVC